MGISVTHGVLMVGIFRDFNILVETICFAKNWELTLTLFARKATYQAFCFCRPPTTRVKPDESHGAYSN
jgi:hypothetical protein